MTEVDPDDDKCNCYDCFEQPDRSFVLKEIIREPSAIKPAVASTSKGNGVDVVPKKAAILPTNSAKTGDESAKTRRNSTHDLNSDSPPPTPTRDSNQHKLFKPPPPLVPETIECEKLVHTEVVQREQPKMELKCASCKEKSNVIDLLVHGSYRVSCTDGCIVTLHPSCIEHALGSGKKKELKTCVCPTDACGCAVTEIYYRAPGISSDFGLWLRCEVKEADKKKIEKTKETKKKEGKEKEKVDHKKDGFRREEDEIRRVDEEENTPPPPPIVIEERPIISLALPSRINEDESKKALVKRLAADLDARPIERKEDALMSKYAVKETTNKETKRRNKKEVRQVILPGLTVKGQRGGYEEEEPWNGPAVVNEEEEGINGNEMMTPEVEQPIDTPFGFAMPQEVAHPLDYNGLGYNVPPPIRGHPMDYGGNGYGMPPPDMRRGYGAPPPSFQHPIPRGTGGIFAPVYMHDHPPPMHLPPPQMYPQLPQQQQQYAQHPQPVQQQQHQPESRSATFSSDTLSLADDEPPLIENPFDYPSLEKDSVRARTRLTNFFEMHIPVLEENAALFDSPKINLLQLKDMLETFIELQFIGEEEDRRTHIETLTAIFMGQVERDIIPFLSELQCFKYGYENGQLFVGVKEERRRRREREDQERREREEEEKRRKEEEERRKKEREEEERQKEEKRKAEVRREVQKLEEKRIKAEEERRQIEMAERRMEEEKARKKNEEERRRRDEERRREEERRMKEAEEKKKKEDNDRRMKEEEARREAQEKRIRAEMERKEEEEKKKKKKEEEERKKKEDEEIKKKEDEERKKKEEEERERMKKIWEEEERVKDEKKREEKEKKEQRQKDMNDEEKKEEELRILKEKKEKEEEERQKMIKLARDERIKKEQEEEEERRRKEAEKKPKDKKSIQKELERKTREAAESFTRNYKQTMGSSDESSSPERKVSGAVSSSIPPPPPPPPSSSSSSAFSLTAPAFVPRTGSLLPLKPNLNPDAPAFVPSSIPVDEMEERPPLVDTTGNVVDEEWIDANQKAFDDKQKEIDELTARVAQLEAEKKKIKEEGMEKEKERVNAETMMTNDKNKRMNEMNSMGNEMKALKEVIHYKDIKISEIALESEKKSTQLTDMATKFNSQLEDMKAKCREMNWSVNEERREKERLMEDAERRDDRKRRDKLQTKAICAKNAIVLCTDIINRLVMDPEAAAMAQMLMELQKKWSNHHQILAMSLEALNEGEVIEWDTILSLEEPSMPRETDQLVEECYVFHYQTMHILSFRLAYIVKRCLKEYKRTYLDAYVVGIIQKWMRIHKDPTKIEAKVPQVANMVAQAMGDTPLFAPRMIPIPLVAPSTPTGSAPVPPSVPRVPVPSGVNTRLVLGETAATTRAANTAANETKGWKKASDKMRQVELHGHECSICLEPTVGGDISYCEQISCNEPYHNNCLTSYWHKGFRNCPRCRKPMPPRDAYPALG